ncbi:glyoxalase/bleomycin resistance protein/dioxygenase [Gongronella butleri]|nr:glyoxalase/bleomycin resistance protein/dioxygenase [Gongronella butleri]
MSSHIINHYDIAVRNFEKSKHFYSELMDIIGAEKSIEIPNVHCAWGAFNFGIMAAKDDGRVSNTHIGFRAATQEQVHAFYDKALALGATDNGKPGYRDYFDGYYAAFVFDLDGNNIEVVNFDESTA